MGIKMYRVSLKNVSKSFGEQTAVIDLSLDIKNGEFIVLLGPTGAGKTTTLRLIAGLEKPESGTIEINGNYANEMSPAQRNICFIFQQYSLYPHYTVYDNIAFPLRSPIHNFSKEEINNRILEVAKMLKIDHKLKNKSTLLSGGEMQRVAIARALVREPLIFLMDEPLSSLDAKMRDELRFELKRIQQDLGATILYVTHDQVEAMTLADRIGVLKNGQLIQVGSPREIYEKPTNIYVAKNLGNPGINILSTDTFKLANIPTEAKFIGVRPEDIRISKETGTEAKILVIECLGAETSVFMETKNQTVYSLLDDSDIAIQEGDIVHIEAVKDNILFFDKNENLIN